MMFRHWILIGAGVVITLVGAACSMKNAATREQPPVVASAQDNDVQGVNALMRANPAPGQPAVIEGVVAYVAPDQHLVTLIDKAEFDECKVTSCAALYLPVRWRGELPYPEDTVTVRGTVAEDNGKLIFHAEEMDKLTRVPDKASHETP